MLHTKVSITNGNITQISADALLTAVNPRGDWFGRIDDAIIEVAGHMYHDQIEINPSLKDLQTIVARGGEPHQGKFRDIIFVIDDMKSPLNKVIYSGLEAVSNEDYQHVLVPTIRMGAARGVVEKTSREVIEQTALGVRRFLDEYAEQTRLQDIEFVVYNNPLLKREMELIFNRINIL